MELQRRLNDVAYSENVRRDRPFRLVAEAVPQIVWARRADGYCDYQNRRWFDYTGMTAQQSAGTGWMDAVHPEDRARLGRLSTPTTASGSAALCDRRSPDGRPTRRIPPRPNWRLVPVVLDQGPSLLRPQWASRSHVGHRHRYHGAQGSRRSTQAKSAGLATRTAHDGQAAVDGRTLGLSWKGAERNGFGSANPRRAVALFTAG